MVLLAWLGCTPLPAGTSPSPSTPTAAPPAPAPVASTPVELCNGADDDGDGLVDEGDLPAPPGWFLDGDGDGFGGEPAALCADPHVYDARDCDDTDPAVHPGVAERCGLDEDCDGLAHPCDYCLVATAADGRRDWLGAGAGVLAVLPAVDLPGGIAPDGLVWQGQLDAVDPWTGFPVRTDRLPAMGGDFGDGTPSQPPTEWSAVTADARGTFVARGVVPVPDMGAALSRIHTLDGRQLLAVFTWGESWLDRHGDPIVDLAIDGEQLLVAQGAAVYAVDLDAEWTDPDPLGEAPATVLAGLGKVLDLDVVGGEIRVLDDTRAVRVFVDRVEVAPLLPGPFLSMSHTPDGAAILVASDGTVHEVVEGSDTVIAPGPYRTVDAGPCPPG